MKFYRNLTRAEVEALDYAVRNYYRELTLTVSTSIVICAAVTWGILEFAKKSPAVNTIVPYVLFALLVVLCFVILKDFLLLVKANYIAYFASEACSFSCCRKVATSDENHNVYVFYIANKLHRSKILYSILVPREDIGSINKEEEVADETK